MYHSHITSEPKSGACKSAVVSDHLRPWRVWKLDILCPKALVSLAPPSPGQVLSGALCAAALLGALRWCWGTAPIPDLQTPMACHHGHTSACPPNRHRCQRRSWADQGWPYSVVGICRVWWYWAGDFFFAHLNLGFTVCGSAYYQPVSPLTGW